MLLPQKEPHLTDDTPSQNHLEPPPMSHEDPGSVELVRFWVTPDMATQVSLRTAFDDPNAWGILLVDLANHVADAYGREGDDREEVLARIKEAFDEEWDNPTDVDPDAPDEA